MKTLAWALRNCDGLCFYYILTFYRLNNLLRGKNKTRYNKQIIGNEINHYFRTSQG